MIAFSIFLVPFFAHAQTDVQGCCEKVQKTTLKIEAVDMFQEPCEAIKTEQEALEDSQKKYVNVTFFPDKVAFLGRCRAQADITQNSSLPKFTIPDLKVSIPGLIKFTQPDFCPNSQDTKICFNWIGQYVGALFNYLTLIMGIIAAITLMAGGVRWLTSAGNSQAVSDAKKWILNSILGLILTLCAYILLVVINPALVSFSPLRVTWLEGVGLLKLKQNAAGSCVNGDCPQIDEACANNSVGIPGAILKSLMVGGEGCNPAVSYDGLGSCGYCQGIPKYRISICGLKGDKSDCELFKKDIQADVNCSAKFVKEQAPRCGNLENIVKTASCYNGGSVGVCGTNDYCHRVEKYYNEKCGGSGSQPTTPPVKP